MITAFSASLHPDSVRALLARRAASLGFVPLPDDYDFVALREQVVALPQYLSFAVFRSWANG